MSITLQAITFHKCKNLKVRDLVLANSQKMHMAFTNCIRVLASHLKLIAPASSPNTDAVHISSSRRVEVKDSIFRTGEISLMLIQNLALRNLAVTEKVRALSTKLVLI